jgi:hypothetical protein
MPGRMDGNNRWMKGIGFSMKENIVFIFSGINRKYCLNS